MQQGRRSCALRVRHAFQTVAQQPNQTRHHDSPHSPCVHPEARDSIWRVRSMNVCKTLSPLNVCSSLFYNMTHANKKTCCSKLFFPHAGTFPDRGLMDIPAGGPSLATCADAVTFQKSTGRCYVVPDVRLLTFLPLTRGKGLGVCCTRRG